MDAKCLSIDSLIRALMLELEPNLSADDVCSFDIPYATPLIYQLDAELRPLSTPLAHPPLKAGWWMADPSRVKLQVRSHADEHCLPLMVTDDL